MIYCNTHTTPLRCFTMHLNLSPWSWPGTRECIRHYGKWLKVEGFLHNWEVGPQSWVTIIRIYRLNTFLISSWVFTVEPPNKGHFGSRAFVLFSEDRSTDLASGCFSFSSTWCKSLLLSFSTYYLGRGRVRYGRFHCSWLCIYCNTPHSLRVWQRFTSNLSLWSWPATQRNTFNI